MGLLDEAIREHLELKLRNGADPQQVAHEEREALEPLHVDPAQAPAYGEDPPTAFVDHGQYSEHFEAEPHEDAETRSQPLPQETVEFDMTSVMEPPDEQQPPAPDEQTEPGQEQLGLE